MKTKVFLINSPTITNQFVGSDNYFPLGLMYLSSVFKKNNIETRILDVNNYYFAKDVTSQAVEDYANNDLINFVNNFKPDIIGIGCIFSGAFTSLKIMAMVIKKAFPNIPIVIGGIHATIFSKEILKKYSFVDFVIVGEGEESFLELVKCISQGGKGVASIDGLAYRDNQEVKLNPKTKFISDPDNLPFPDYTAVDIAEYNMDTSGWYSPKKLKIGQPYNVITSRSCPQHCTFCSMWLVHGLKTRVRSAENVLDEIEFLYNEHGVRYFEFMDDNMTFDKQRTLDICRGILKRKLDIQFGTPNGVAMNRLDKEIIEAMVEAGMIWISVAPESGSEYIRNKCMRKGLSDGKIYEIINACATYEKLFIKGFFIIGMPQETHETLEETYKMIKELPLDKYQLSFATAYPGTELFDYCIKNKLIEYRLEDYMDIEDLQFRSNKPHFKPHNLELEDLIEFQIKGYGYMDELRAKSKVPMNYPLRYKGAV
ncbi:MAG: radical SAM protein [Atribacterota bacterium]|nr:radical SAM protein [Atribacterota bacterium]